MRIYDAPPLPPFICAYARLPWAYAGHHIGAGERFWRRSGMRENSDGDWPILRETDFAPCQLDGHCPAVAVALPAQRTRTRVLFRLFALVLDLLPMSLAFPPGLSLSWLRKVERRLSDLALDAHASSARPYVRRQFSAPRRSVPELLNSRARLYLYLLGC